MSGAKSRPRSLRAIEPQRDIGARTSILRSVADRELAAKQKPELRRCLPRPWSDFVADPWWAELARSQAAVLVLDYDGTLAPFSPRRMEAVPCAGVPDGLLYLAQIAELRVVLISGRRASELRTLFPPQLKLEIWGSHGRERLMPAAEMELVPLQPPQEELLREFEQQAQREGFCIAVESKIGSVALHTPGRRAELAERIRQFATSFVNHSSDGLELLDFNGGLELRVTGQTRLTPSARS